MAQQKDLFTIEGYRKALKSKGLKATGQRLAVHEAMLELGHASADMVSERIREQGGSVTVSSVYNILSQLSLLGIYHRRLSAGSKMYFDVNTGRHLHMYDIVNNEYKDLVDDDLMDIVESRLKKRRFKGYRVESIDVQLVCRPSTHRRSRD